MVTSRVDCHIGSKVRLRRKALNISLYSLSYDIGISLQQLQKYESGANRIAASKLYAISKVLKVSPHFFFEGLDGVVTGVEMLGGPKIIKAFNVMNKITNQKVKNKILGLIMELEV